MRITGLTATTKWRRWLAVTGECTRESERAYRQLTPSRSRLLIQSNHPSVVIWSLCNEGMCDRGIAKGPNNEPGWDYSGRKSKAIFQQWDPSMQRPVSANPHDFGNWSTNYTILNLIGLDYPCAHGPCYDRTHLIAPTIPIIGSEMGSTTSDRGVYALSTNVSKGRGDGGAVPQIQASMQRSAGCWLPVMEHDYVSGAFEWSGFGERARKVILQIVPNFVSFRLCCTNPTTRLQRRTCAEHLAGCERPFRVSGHRRLP